jgi:hypothetical protein
MPLPPPQALPTPAWRAHTIAEALALSTGALTPDQNSLRLEDEFGIGIKELIVLLIAFKISEKPGGMKLLETLGKEFIKGTFDTLHSLGQASAANSIAAWANPYLISIVLERFGFVPSNKMLEFRVGLSIIAGAATAESIIDTIQGIFPFSSPEKSEFPDNIVYSARTEGGHVVEETVGSKGLSAKELEQLRSLLSKIPK